MNTVEALNTLKSFLQESIKSCELQKDIPDNVYKYELVQPNVVVGWLPPRGYLPEEMDTYIPCIIVGLENGIDNGEEGALSIKLSFAVYSPGEHMPDSSYTPSFNGYVDLLNLMDTVKAALIKSTIIENRFRVSDEIKWQMYEEQPYPYWYSFMTFEVTSTSYPKTEIEKLLNI